MTIFRTIILALSLAAGGCVTVQNDPATVPAAIAFSADPRLASNLSPDGRQRLFAAEQTALNAASAREPVVWTVNDSENGTVSATQPFRVGRKECRRIIHSVAIGSGNRSVAATACQSPSGAWVRVG